MKKLLFLIAFTTITLGISFATEHTVSYSGYHFSPAEINIVVGDTVIFELSNYHNAVEVSEATYNANGNTPNGGFDVPYSGGTHVFETPGTYYYVCTPHAMYGMKGIITVSEPLGLNNNVESVGDIVISPNPVIDYFNLDFKTSVVSDIKVSLLDITGALINKLSHENYGEGNYQLTYRIDRGLNPGLYFILLETANEAYLEKLIVL